MMLVWFVLPRLAIYFMPFVIGWIIAMIAYPLVKFLERHLKLVRKHSSAIIVVLVLALVIGVLYLVISRLVIEVTGLISDLPRILGEMQAELQDAVGGLARLIQRLPKAVRDWFSQVEGDLDGVIASIFSGIATPTVAVAGNVARMIPELLVYTIVTFMSAYLFIVERERINQVLKRVIPESVWNYLYYLKNDLLKLIGGYFLAQFRIMFVVAVVLTVGFMVLDVSYGVVWAVLISILDFLPVFGTGTVLFPWALLKVLSGEYGFAAGLIILYILAQVVRQIIQPKIVSESMGLSPLATLFLLYLGFKVSGISGMILAVPIGIVVVNLYKYGMFDSLLANLKLLVEEVNRFRRSDL